MIIYEHSVIKVNVDDLENSLSEYSKAGWEVVSVLPSVYSSMTPTFTELFQVLVVMRSKIGDTATI